MLNFRLWLFVCGFALRIIYMYIYLQLINIELQLHFAETMLQPTTILNSSGKYFVTDILWISFIILIIGLYTVLYTIWKDIVLVRIVLKTRIGLDACGVESNTGLQYNTDSHNIFPYYIFSSNKGIFARSIWPEVNCPYFHTPGK